MAARVTDAQLRKIITLAAGLDTTEFITSANTMVNLYLVPKQPDFPAMTEAVLAQVELYLAAHFAAIFKPREESVSFGKGTFSWQGKTAMGLDHTKYGQQAKLFDPSGTLAQIDQQSGPQGGGSASLEFIYDEDLDGK